MVCIGKLLTSFLQILIHQAVTPSIKLHDFDQTSPASMFSTSMRVHASTCVRMTHIVQVAED